MKCPAVYIANSETHHCERRRQRHWGKHRARFLTLWHDYNGRVIASSKTTLVWAEWKMEVPT